MGAFGIPDHVIEDRKERFPAGARVELIRMDDPYRKLDPGEKGTVTGVDDIGTIHVNWDCGSCLGVAYGEDEVKSLVPDFTKKVHDGILAIRDTGKTNMFDSVAVQRLANEMNLFETVLFIEDHRKEYSRFILEGHV